MIHHSVTRRVISLLNQVAANVEDSVVVHEQMEGAIAEARQHQEDNQRLKQVRIRKFVFLVPDNSVILNNMATI